MDKEDLNIYSTIIFNLESKISTSQKIKKQVIFIGKVTMRNFYFVK